VEDFIVAVNEEKNYSSAFIDYAGNDTGLWNNLIGCRITHTNWGNGTILSFAFGKDANSSTVRVQFDHPINSVKYGLTAIVDLGLIVFNNGVASDISLPPDVIETLREKEGLEIKKAEQERRRIEQSERQARLFDGIKRAVNWIGNMVDKIGKIWEDGLRIGAPNRGHSYRHSVDDRQDYLAHYYSEDDFPENPGSLTGDPFFGEEYEDENYDYERGQSDYIEEEEENEYYEN
jgi:hypothetical protein